jgi:hypothetical protein
MLRRLSPALALLVGLILAIALAGVSTAANSKYRTFGTGQVSIAGGSATISNGPGEYGGVYLRSRSMSAKPLRAVHFSFDYSGSVAGGAPRFSIPLDTNHDRHIDGYAFVDALNCGDTGTVSTDDNNCKVFLNFGSESFDNWDDLVASHPGWRLPPRAIPFVIADQPGTYRISHIDLR